jgi:hypothetical protein
MTPRGSASTSTLSPAPVSGSASFAAIRENHEDCKGKPDNKRMATSLSKTELNAKLKLPRIESQGRLAE